jgi:PPOX class probable F420-dependent enzyme
MRWLASGFGWLAARPAPPGRGELGYARAPMKLPESVIDQLLDTWPVARLATIDSGGRPHLVPIVFARVRGYLWSPVDGKRKGRRELARVHHVRANPAVSVLLDHYDADWSQLWWVRLDAVARVVTPLDPTEDPDVGPAVTALRRKYLQYERVELLRDPPTVLALQPKAVRSWCAGPEAVPHSRSAG